ncbi:MAG: hypothetical protein H6828_09530 [Planctomycetes bacterium]|nr:hypothetical protein [Planctomycetota bacterium]
MSDSKPADAAPVIDPGLLEILACPATHQPLRVAQAAELERVNARIAAGEQKTAGGEVVGQRVAAGLVREDGAVLYPIRDRIPVLLVDEGLPL